MRKSLAFVVAVWMFFCLTACGKKPLLTKEENTIEENVEYQVTQLALQRVEEIAQENGDLFYRVEYLPRNLEIDSALGHENTLTFFSEDNNLKITNLLGDQGYSPAKTTALMGDLGYCAFKDDHYYKSFVAPVDSLFSLKYLVLKHKLTSHPQLELVDQVYIEDPTTGGVMEDEKSGEKYIRYIYRNRLALPVGFATSSKLAEFDNTSSSPFACQQELYECMTGLDNQIYYDLEFDSNSDGASISDNRFHMSGDATFYATVEEQGQYFAYVDCQEANSISVDKYDAEGNYQSSWSMSPHEPFIIDMGTLRPGEGVEVAVSGDYAASGNCYVMRLDTEALDAHLQVLQTGGLDVTWQDGSGFGGTYTAQEAGAMFFSVPYDEDWVVLVDGKKVETFAVDGALLGANIPAGTHEVEVRL